MKKLASFTLVFALLLSTMIINAQEKKNQTPTDTTLTLSLPALEKKIAELKVEYEKQIKARDDAKVFLQTTENNIVSLTAMINTIETLKRDMQFQIKKEK
jgi:hypothetical protein